MWVEYRRVPGLILAQMWKDLYEGEGLPCRIIPDQLEKWESEFAEYRVCIPRGREHVAEEIDRKV